MIARVITDILLGVLVGGVAALTLRYGARIERAAHARRFRAIRARLEPVRVRPGRRVDTVRHYEPSGWWRS